MEDEITNVQDQIERRISILRKISELDMKIAELKNIEAGIPHVIETVGKKSREAAEEVLAMESRIPELKKELREKEGEVKGFQEQIGNKRSKLTDVRTNKEYSAILTELELFEGKIGESEERQLAIMEELEVLDGALKRGKANLKEEKQKFEEFKKQKEVEKVRLKETVEEETVNRAEISDSLDPELVRMYDRMSKTGKKNIVVAYKSQACQICFARVTPQDEVLMRRGKDIISCPQCGRFLYWGE